MKSAQHRERLGHSLLPDEQGCGVEPRSILVVSANKSTPKGTSRPINATPTARLTSLALVRRAGAFIPSRPPRGMGAANAKRSAAVKPGEARRFESTKARRTGAGGFASRRALPRAPVRAAPVGRRERRPEGAPEAEHRSRARRAASATCGLLRRRAPRPGLATWARGENLSRPSSAAKPPRTQEHGAIARDGPPNVAP